MSDLDLDELRSELDDFAQPEKKGGRSAREERIIAGFEDTSSGLSKSMGARRNMERIEIFSNGYTPYASTVCARLRNAVRFSLHSTIRDC